MTQHTEAVDGQNGNKEDHNRKVRITLIAANARSASKFRQKLVENESDFGCRRGPSYKRPSLLLSLRIQTTPPGHCQYSTKRLRSFKRPAAMFKQSLHIASYFSK